VTEPLVVLPFIDMEFIEKQEELERIIQELRDLQEEWVRISGEYSKMRARIQVLKERKSSLQTSMKWEGF
jgi:predicted nuclease with TOPRIM domain